MSNLIIFIPLFLCFTTIHTMNVEQPYAFALRENDDGRCMIKDDVTLYPFFLGDKKHTSLLHESLWDQFSKKKVFALSMAKQDRLPIEIGNTIVKKWWIIENQKRNKLIEKILQVKYGISYHDLCYATKAQKQFLFYCVNDAQLTDGTLTIEGIDEKFSEEMLQRFYSMFPENQTKISRHVGGNSLYVKMDYKKPFLCNRLLGQDYAVREKNIERLATVANFVTPGMIAAIIIAAAMQKDIPNQILALYVSALRKEFILLKDITDVGIALGMSKATMTVLSGAMGVLGMMMLTTLVYIPGLGIPLALFALGLVTHDKVLHFKQPLSEVMRSNGFREFVPMPYKK